MAATTTSPGNGQPVTTYTSLSTANGATGIGLTNYMAMLGTHIDPTATGPSGGTKSASSSASNNGAMTFRGTSFDQGRKLAGLTDGASRRRWRVKPRRSGCRRGTMGPPIGYAVQCHGNLTGVLVNPPASSTTTGNVNGLNVNGKWVVGSNGTTTNGAGHAINVGPSPTTPQAVYMPTGSVSDPNIYVSPHVGSQQRPRRRHCATRLWRRPRRRFDRRH